MTTEDARLLFEGLTALGALVAATQVWFVRGQLKDTRRWNQMSFALQYLANWENISQMERDLNASFLKLLDRTGTLSHDEIEKLMSDEERNTRDNLSRFLNAIESYCAAVNLGIADERVAERLYGHKFPRHYTELKPYIEHERTELNAPGLYSELEMLVKKWTPLPTNVPRYP